MYLSHLISSESSKAAGATTVIAALRDMSGGDPQVIEVSALVYTSLAVALSMAGVYLARLVTVGEEDKKLGRVQTLRETGPLTWIALLIVAPLIWHFNIAVPWAAIIGLGTGYTVRTVLKIVGGGVVNAARGMVRGIAGAIDERESLSSAKVPDDDDEDAPTREALIRQLGDVPPTPTPPAPETDH